MVGRVTSAIGLIVAAIFMLVVGYLLTLNVYQYEGAYVIFYSGRYYAGIACMIVSGVLFFAGVAVPFIWPHNRSESKLSSHVAKPGNLEPPSSENQLATQGFEVMPSQKSSNLSSVGSKIIAISMQSTCGAESLKILKILLQRHGTMELNLSSIIEEISTEENKAKKAISLLLNLGLIEKRTSNIEETYIIPTDLLLDISKSIDSIN